jgi:two-component system, cell cycle sensor histidine kinase PleC
MVINGFSNIYVVKCKGGKNMLRESLYKNRYKVIHILMSVLFVVIWISILLTLNQMQGSAAEISAYRERLTYLLNFLMVDSFILITSMLFWITSIKKKYQKNILIKDEKDRVIDAQQLELEKQKSLLYNMTTLYNQSIEYERLKSEFFSNISHELKTPLSVILGAIQLIDKGYFHELNRRKSDKHNKTIKQNCYRLIRLLNNILDMNKLDSGFIKICPVNCNIVYLIEEITQSVAPFAEQKGVSLEFDTEYEEIITGVDVDKIERIILNLLSNSIKFTPSGGKVSVTLKTISKKIFISVKDTGLGIPSDMQKSIFERFKQIGSTLTKDFEGTGIGLSLVKSFVELHNGTITVISEVNKGSEFIIELPITLASTDSENQVIEPKIQNKIIQAINIEFSDIYSIAS